MGEGLIEITRAKQKKRNKGHRPTDFIIFGALHYTERMAPDRPEAARRSEGMRGGMGDEMDDGTVGLPPSLPPSLPPRRPAIKVTYAFGAGGPGGGQTRRLRCVRGEAAVACQVEDE